MWGLKSFFNFITLLLLTLQTGSLSHSCFLPLGTSINILCFQSFVSISKSLIIYSSHLSVLHAEWILQIYLPVHHFFIQLFLVCCFTIYWNLNFNYIYHVLKFSFSNTVYLFLLTWFLFILLVMLNAHTLKSLLLF